MHLRKSPCPYFQVSLHATVCGKLCSSYTVSTIQHATVEVSTIKRPKFVFQRPLELGVDIVMHSFVPKTLMVSTDCVNWITCNTVMCG